jgi:hypothetical protein
VDEAGQHLPGGIGIDGQVNFIVFIPLPIWWQVVHPPLTHILTQSASHA